MLEEYGYITTDMKFKNLVPIFYNDPRWKAVDDKEKEDEFQKFLEELFAKESKVKDDTIKRY